MSAITTELRDDETSFDNVIVGAGSAGCVLAARLSEDSDRTVLLIEAGNRPRGIVARMPAAAGINFVRPGLNWCLETVPQRELVNRRVFIAAGKGLGGSSAINAMCYMRGHPDDYNGWAEGGAKGWAYADVLPYFKRNEAYDSGGDPTYRGQRGPFVTTKAQIHGRLQEAFVAAGDDDEAGLTDDPNGFRQEGFFTCDRAIRRGERVSSSTAYLDPILDRPNLRILTGAAAHRVVLENRRAVGVAYATDGQLRQVRARHEVILSAGAIRSPHLLMLSGIGPADHLGDNGITVEADLPAVGAHLEDHVEVQVTFGCRQPVSHSRYMRADRKLAAGLRWLLFKDGIGATTGFEAGALIRSTSNLPSPNMQIFLYPALFDETLPTAGVHGFGLGMNLNRCQSRGTIRLGSSDPAARPSIDPAYLTEPDDLELLVDAVERARAIVASSSFDGLRGEEIGPGSKARSRSDIAQWVRHVLIGNWHLAGTCRMGNGSDTVTDSQGRVHGIERLRVVDASSMPRVVNANLAATVMMMAEKISDPIRERPALEPQPAPYAGAPAMAVMS
ncbi:MAG: choline dehydrogenase [Rhodospirillaceae bacterium]|nr:choline dehydrogenase [Rhodospirillaceae bacterium]